MQNHYTINIHAGQVSLHFGADPNGTAAEIDSAATALISQLLRNDFEPRKRHNMHLADAYSTSGMTNGTDKAVRLATCARWLEFALPPEAEDKRYKVTKTTSCHVRLCPVCQWRRSLNTFRNLATMYAAPALQGYKHIFVTLTQRNVMPEDLAPEIKRINDAYAAMMRRKPFKNIVKGACRTIEVTRNTDPKSKDYGTYHPHIHAIWSVPASYGHKEYISQATLTQEWKKALGENYKPRVDMRMIKGNRPDGKAIAEVAKYSVKPGDYISDRIETTAEIIKILDPALDGKRFVSYSGVVRQVKQDIFQSAYLEDVETETVSEAELEGWERVLYEWHFSEQKYVKITV